MKADFAGIGTRSARLHPRNDERLSGQAAQRWHPDSGQYRRVLPPRG